MGYAFSVKIATPHQSCLYKNFEKYFPEWGFYRKTNTQSPRYRKNLAEVAEIACELADSGVHLIDLTLGEDPFIHDTGNFQLLFQMIERVKEETDKPLQISLITDHGNRDGMDHLVKMICWSSLDKNGNRILRHFNMDVDRGGHS